MSIKYRVVIPVDNDLRPALAEKASELRKQTLASVQRINELAKRIADLEQYIRTLHGNLYQKLGQWEI